MREINKLEESILTRLTRKNKEYAWNNHLVASNDDNIFIIEEDNYLNVAFDDCFWIIGSGASFHVTPHEGFFSSYQKEDFGTVKIRNHVKSKIVGIGEVTLITENDNKLVIS